MLISWHEFQVRFFCRRLSVNYTLNHVMNLIWKGKHITEKRRRVTWNQTRPSNQPYFRCLRRYPWHCQHCYDDQPNKSHSEYHAMSIAVPLVFLPGHIVRPPRRLCGMSRTAFMFPAFWSTLFYETSFAMNFVTTDSRRSTEMQVGLPSLRQSLFSWLHQCLWNIRLCTSKPYGTDNTCPIIDYFFSPSRSMLLPDSFYIPLHSYNLVSPGGPLGISSVPFDVLHQPSRTFTKSMSCKSHCLTTLHEISSDLMSLGYRSLELSNIVLRVILVWYSTPHWTKSTWSCKTRNWQEILSGWRDYSFFVVNTSTVVEADIAVYDTVSEKCLRDCD
jgi:hypothetical protein